MSGFSNTLLYQHIQESDAQLRQPVYLPLIRSPPKSDTVFIGVT